MKCFYHNDPDGWCSGYWIRKHCESKGIQYTKDDFIEMNYDKEFPWEILTHGEKIFMVDFSLSDRMHMALLAKDYDFTWIDHHKTAIDKMQGVEIKGIQSDSVSACALTWLWNVYGDIKESTDSGMPKFCNMIKDAPLSTQYIDQWDTWRWKEHPDAEEIEEFITALTGHGSFNDPVSIFWDTVNDDMNDAVCELVNVGSAMVTFRDGYAKGMCDSIGKVLEFEGYRCYVCNVGHCSSEWFKSVDKNTYDILMPFYYNANTELFIISLYGKGDINVSEIAVKYGGGGHPNASGFSSKVLPWVS